MKHLLLSSIIAMTALIGVAQVQHTILELPDANVRINNNLLLFDELNSMPAYEAPAGSNNHAIYRSTLWISGLDADDNIHTSAVISCNENGSGFCEFSPGPLTTDGTASNDPAVFAKYNRLWFISRLQVEAHAAYFTCLYDPTCNTETLFPEGYTVPDEILEWPAHGNTSLGQPYYLAPFVDVNGNGAYQPQYGDYPSFTGDEAVYMISNDVGEHVVSGGTPFGMEVHTLIYYYLDSHPALSRTTYIHQDFINRSLNDYHDVYIGIFNDFDLGNWLDDQIGTDVENSYVYVYNGYAFDEPSMLGPGYGVDLPMMACKILAGPYLDPNDMDDAGSFNGTQEYGDYTKGWNDGIVDNERMGLSSSIDMKSYGQSEPYGYPQSPEEYNKYLRSTFVDDTPLTFGGTGYNPDNPDLPLAKYVFPGTSDPYFMGTDGVDPNYPINGGWTELNAGIPANNKMIISTMGPFSLNAGQKQSIDYVYVFAQQSDDPDSNLHDLLTEYVNIASNQVDSLPAGVITSVKNVQPEQIGFGLYPNPAANEITIVFSGNVKATTYRIFNVLGAQVKSGELKGEKTTVDVSGLNHGLYLVNVAVGDRVATRKLVVE